MCCVVGTDKHDILATAPRIFVYVLALIDLTEQAVTNDDEDSENYCD
jgi:hypothetical protein